MSKISELESKILKHKALYYRGEPEISDREYDEMEEQLRELAPDSKVLVTVGSIVKSNKKIPHQKKMLSLNKSYNLDEVEKWRKGETFVSTFKIDGSSCSLVYEKGSLVLAKTRGDGSVGEDIIDKALWISSIPKTVKEKRSFEVRGEIFCKEGNFHKISEEMDKRKLPRPSSMRNIVAGLLGRKDKIDLCQHLSFQAFEYLGEKAVKTEIEKFDFLEGEGFDIPRVELHKNIKSAEKVVKHAEQFMQDGDYLIDGVVFTINDQKAHREWGETAHHPRYKIAYKFVGLSKETKIKSITWQVSRNSILTPVAEVEPIELSNAMVSRVTLHNFGVVKDYNLKSGDTIEIIRSGEVIPKFLSVIKSVKGDYEIPPNPCGNCKKAPTIEDIRLICKNHFCPTRDREVILHFVKKIGIDDVSSKRLEEMMEKNLISDPSDLYNLTTEKLLTLDKTKEKLAQKIYDNIQRTKKTSLVKFLSSLGIAGGAENKCEKIIDAGFNTIEKILKMEADSLVRVESFAEKSATDFVESLKERKDLIESLLQKGFEFPVVEKEDGGRELEGKSFVITGTLSRKRSEVEKFVKNNGGKVSGSVSKNTDYLVTNDTESSSSKFKKAIELEIPILTEEKLEELAKASF